MIHIPSRFTLLLGAVAVATAILAASPAVAQNWNGNGDGVDWNDPSNWDTATVPDGTLDVGIAMNGSTTQTVSISNANAAATGLFVGLEFGGVVVDATVNHSAFTGDYTAGMVIGRGGATGTYNQTLTSVVNAGFVDVGTIDSGAATEAGTGFYNMSGDSTLNVTSNLIMGQGLPTAGANSTGTMVMNDNAVANVGEFVLVSEQPGSTGTLTLNGNSILNANRIDHSMVVGRQNATGTMNVNDSAAVNSAGAIIVGDFEDGTGEVNQTGGTVSAGKWITLGGGSSSPFGTTKGTYNLSGGSVSSDTDFIIGDNGQGFFNQTGGSVGANNLWIGNNSGIGSPKGEYNITGTGVSSVTAKTSLLVGRFGDDATFNQDNPNSTVTVDGSGGNGAWVSVGHEAGSVGTYNLSAGLLNAGNDLQVGENGTGTMEQTGGSATAGWVRVGNRPGSDGTYNLSGGTISASSDIMVGVEGTGVLTQTGGTATASGWVRVGDAAGGNGTYNLNVGNLNTGRVVVGGAVDGAGGVGAFNINGGTLTTTDSINIGRHGDGSLSVTSGTVNTQFIFVGGDAGTTSATLGGRVSLSGGTVNASNDVNMGLNTNSGAVGLVGMTVSGNAVLNVTGGLEVARIGTADLTVVGSGATIDVGANLDASVDDPLADVGAVAILRWESDVSGVSAISVGGAASPAHTPLVDVDGALLQLDVASAPATDLLLVDNQGPFLVNGLFELDSNSDGVGEGALAQGDSVGGGYFISYFGSTGFDNDISLTLAPVSIQYPDYNGNGVVDAADYTLYRDGNIAADGNGDLVVDQLDYDIWAMFFGSVVPGPSVSVPEPTTAILVLSGLLLCGPFNRRRC